MKLKALKIKFKQLCCKVLAGEVSRNISDEITVQKQLIGPEYFLRVIVQVLS
jgi:hypothetical protein